MTNTISNMNPFMIMMMNTEKTTSSSKTSRSKTSSRTKKQRPSKPRSAYDIFFEEQRSKILLTALKNGKMTSQEIANVVNSEVRDCRHRRKEGKIGRREIKHKVQSLWKALSTEKRQYYEDAAQDDLKRCQAQLKAWAAAQQQQQDLTQVIAPQEDSCLMVSSTPPPMPEIFTSQNNNLMNSMNINTNVMPTSPLLESMETTSQTKNDFSFPAFSGGIVADSMNAPINTMSSTHTVTSCTPSTTVSANDRWMTSSPTTVHTSQSSISSCCGDSDSRSCSSEPAPFTNMLAPTMEAVLSSYILQQQQREYEPVKNNTNDNMISVFVQQQQQQQVSQNQVSISVQKNSVVSSEYDSMLASYDSQNINHVELQQQLEKEGRRPNTNNNTTTLCDDPSLMVVDVNNSFLASQLDGEDVDFICSTFINTE